ncbi:hypothetical protein FDP22_13085 [Paroceanicella profunda]|uniref:Uncharacterized protein n=1 Tax=Paroceanicella profunda TaxID=2579971 RepID=A0A5B8G0K2_9RHOB|nr:hypothetical protein [Paroceanicella profunda]QDL92639.1 hypothetical protein FDP22_13085 [Paroceanicella profunda]
MKKIVVAGGGNSLPRDGYVARLADMAKLPVHNLSTDATTSLTALFRLQVDPEVEPGDIVLWEYALHEINHVARGQDADALLHEVEQLIRYCIRQRLMMMALVLEPLGVGLSLTEDPYTQRLQALFDSYGVVHVSLKRAYKEKFEHKRLPKKFFSGPDTLDISNIHLMSFAANLCARMVGLADVPRQPRSELRLTGETHFAFVNDFATGTLADDMIRLPVGQLPLDLEVTEDGVLDSLIYVATPDGGGVKVTIGAREIPLALQHRNLNFPRPMLRLLRLETVFGEPCTVSRGDRITIAWETTPGSFRFPSGEMHWMPEAVVAGRTGRIAALGFSRRDEPLALAPLRRLAPQKDPAQMAGNPVRKIAGVIGRALRTRQA